MALSTRHDVSLEQPEAARWQAICDSDPACTFFQTPTWGGFVATLDPGWQNGTVLMRFRDGVEIVVPRAKMRSHRVFIRSESVPVGLYGAPVTARERLDRHHLAAVEALYRTPLAAEGVLVEVPGQPLDLRAEREVRTTQMIRLDPSDTEPSLLARYRKGHRDDIRAALRGGLSVSKAETTSDVAEYYDLYLDTVRRWMRAPFVTYRRESFLYLLAASREGGRVAIWTCRRKQELLAGAVVLTHARHAAYWHACSTQSGRAAHAGHLVVHAAILDASSAGARVFDFLPSAGLEQVELFKSGFGAVPVELGIHRFPGGASFRSLRRVRALVSGH